MNYYQNDSGKGTFTFRPWINESGTYDVSIWYPSDEDYSGAAQVIINHIRGNEKKLIDLRESGGQWVNLGRYNLGKGYREVVTINAENSGGIVVADAIKLSLID